MDIIELLRNFGFPAGISIYFIVSLNKTIQKNTKILGELKNSIDILCKKE